MAVAGGPDFTGAHSTQQAFEVLMTHVPTYPVAVCWDVYAPTQARKLAPPRSLTEAQPYVPSDSALHCAWAAAHVR